MSIFRQRYPQGDSPLAYVGANERNADFSDWHLHLHPDVIEAARTTNSSAGLNNPQELLELEKVPLLCCPEDHRCRFRCAERKLLCSSCEVPVRMKCQLAVSRLAWLSSSTSKQTSSEQIRQQHQPSE